METLSLYDLTVPQFIRMLTNLSLILEKGTDHAQAKKIEPTVLLNSRLIADQFPLIKQIQIACDASKFGVSRLTGKEAPKHPDTETTLPEIQARLQSVISFLKSVKPEDFAGANSRKVTQARVEGKYIDGRDYLVQLALPNFYFHVTTAYSILRANGVTLGKSDYLGSDVAFKPL